MMRWIVIFFSQTNRKQTRLLSSLHIPFSLYSLYHYTNYHKLKSQLHNFKPSSSMAAVSCNKPHVLAVPVPAQGHVKPLMNLCRQIAKHGVKVTFVNAQTIHNKIVAAAEISPEEEEEMMVLTSLPEGLKHDDDPNDPFVIVETLSKTMPESLQDLIEKINSSNPNEKISCVIADISYGWVLDIAEMMGAEPVGFSPASAASSAIILHIPTLIQQGNLDINGTLKKVDCIKLLDDIPAFRKDELPWSVSHNLKIQKIIFECMKTSYKASNKAKWVLWNSCYELEPATCGLYPNLLPIGPLNLRDKSCSDSSNFYVEDASCLRWLDNKPDGSVIYVSFGSLAVFSQQQLDELALGLELSGRAFLWVTRPDLANGSKFVYPDGFLERVSKFGKIVEWAPQNRVLSHPAIGCFISHCGWNSTLEGVSKGVPYLCWPYFADQAHNESYICDKWEIGLRINCDESGMRSRDEIKKKIDMIFTNDKFKENAFKLKEICAKSVSEGGTSYENLKTFIDHLRK